MASFQLTLSSLTLLLALMVKMSHERSFTKLGIFKATDQTKKVFMNLDRDLNNLKKLSTILKLRSLNRLSTTQEELGKRISFEKQGVFHKLMKIKKLSQEEEIQQPSPSSRKKNMDPSEQQKMALQSNQKMSDPNRVIGHYCYYTQVYKCQSIMGKKYCWKEREQI
uniref:Cnidarian restricted protein n=1 Tax=Clytia hemisphaerica TaxID=252671 RepID=A0A7M5WZ31_9CNID